MFEDDFEDEEQQAFVKNEWQPKSPFGKFMKKFLKVLKKLPKYLFFTLIAVVWILIFAVMAMRSNDGIVKTPLLSDEARLLYTSAPEDFDVYEIHTADFMNSDGTIQLFKSVYAEDAHELEGGLRIKGQIGETLYCRIKDDKGNIKNEVFRRTRERNYKLSDSVKFEYVFERISFGDVYIDVSRNIINRDNSVDISEELSRFESDVEDYSAYIDQSSGEIDGKEPKGVLYFEIYESPESAAPIFSCIIYDDDTPLELIDFRIADEKYLQ